MQLSLLVESLARYFENHVSITKGKPQLCRIGVQWSDHYLGM